MEADEFSDEQMDVLDEDDGKGHIGTPAQIQEQVKKDYLAAHAELAKTDPIAQCITGLKEDRYERARTGRWKMGHITKWHPLDERAPYWEKKLGGPVPLCFAPGCTFLAKWGE